MTAEIIHVSNRRSRYRRGAPEPFRMTERVAQTLVDLYHLGAADTHTVALLYNSHGPDAARYFFKVWPRVWRAGFVTKIAPPVSAGLTGSTPDLYLVENGTAQAVMEGGRGLDALPPSVAADLRTRADADRERLLAVLAPRLGDPSVVARRLKLHGEHARRCLTASTNLLAHAAKNAAFVATILYAARKRNLRVLALRGDKDVLCSAATEAGLVTTAPDTAIAIETESGVQALLVETETGSASVQKLRAKVAAWAQVIGAAPRPGFRALVAAALGVPRVDRVQIAFYGPPRVLAHVEAAAANAGRARPVFATVRDDVVHIAYPAAVVRTNGVIAGTDTRCLAHFARLAAEPVAGVVVGECRDSRPEVRWFPLLP